MKRSIHVRLLPVLFEPPELLAGTAVIIDVLRASTTMIQALHSRANRILPCADIEEARQRAVMIPPTERLLGGERGGVLIDGFDLGNSPRQYTPDRVAGRSLIFTTTNGTAALRRAEQAANICIGAFVNFRAVADYLQQIAGPIHLVCAGTNGDMTAEDILFAGLLADHLLKSSPNAAPPPDVATEMAIAFARQHGASPDQILHTLRCSLGGSNLRNLGMDEDIVFAARCDTLPVVPVWDATTGELRILNSP